MAPFDNCLQLLGDGSFIPNPLNPNAEIKVGCGVNIRYRNRDIITASIPLKYGSIAMAEFAAVLNSVTLARTRT